MNDEQTFESAMAELEKIVRQLESDEMKLEDAMQVVKRSQELILFCEKKLESVREQLTVLDQKNED